MKKHIRLFEILFCVFALVLAVMIALSVAGTNNASIINDALGVQSYAEKLSVDPDDSDVEWEREDYEYYPQTYETEDELKEEYAALCQEIEEEGIVLLKNEGNALPLAAGSNVSLFGQGSSNFNYKTSGSSSNVTTSDYATLYNVLTESGINVNKTLWDFYNSDAYLVRNRSYNYERGLYGEYYMQYETPYSNYTSVVKESYSSYGDAAIFTISRSSGEGRDLPAANSDGADGSYLTLTETEIELLKELSSLKTSGTFKSIIVILNTSATVQLDFLDDYGVDAVLWVGNSGSHGLYGVAEVLCGKVNPSGKSVDTYLKDNYSSPAMASWSYNPEKIASQEYDNSDNYVTFFDTGQENRINNMYSVYVEGIYVGYRYYETRYEDYVLGNTTSYNYGADVTYPFGYGLSYTTFDYSEFSVTPSSDGESYEVSVKVTNKGPYAGKEVVDVYLQKPYTPYDKQYGVEKASVELVGYAKTGTLAAADGSGENGGSETVKITVDKEQFKSYDSYEAETYILENGDYYLAVGNGSHEAVNNILALKATDSINYNFYATRMDAQGTSALASKISLTSDKADTQGVDSTTYAVSTETGEEITNQLDYADLKLYNGAGSNANAFEYVTRSDWDGTFPTTNVKLSVATAQMGTDLLSDNQKESMGHDELPEYGAEGELSMYNMMGLDYDDPKWEDLLDQMTYSEQALLTTDGYHLTNAVASVNKRGTKDENGPTSVDGSVTGYCLPSEGVWAATFNDKLIERIGKLMGDDCVMAGIDGLYAPGVNMHRTGFCGRTHEYFSEDPYLSGMASMYEIRGIQSRGVVAYVKHFAFNEIERNRNGIGIWLNEQSAREIYLLPFEYSMRPSMGNAHACMTSFNRAGCTWTSASPELLTNIARGEWNYDGFYITDSSSGNGALYMTYYDGIMAGTNLYDGTGTSSSLNSYKNDPDFCYMLRESCHRMLYVICNYSVSMNGMTEYTEIYTVTAWWQILITTLEIICIVGVVATAALYVVAEVFKWRGRDESGDAVSGGGGVHPRDVDDDVEAENDLSSDDRE